jgi:hypothetical protein
MEIYFHNPIRLHGEVLKFWDNFSVLLLPYVLKNNANLTPYLTLVNIQSVLVLNTVQSAFDNTLRELGQLTF